MMTILSYINYNSHYNSNLSFKFIQTIIIGCELSLQHQLTINEKATVVIIMYINDPASLFNTVYSYEHCIIKEISYPYKNYFTLVLFFCIDKCRGHTKGSQTTSRHLKHSWYAHPVLNLCQDHTVAGFLELSTKIESATAYLSFDGMKNIDLVEFPVWCNFVRSIRKVLTPRIKFGQFPFSIINTGI